MQTQNRLLDDLARVASGALGIATGMRSEAEARLREQFERIIQQMDLVTREDHEVALAMAQKAREEQEAMAERMAALEKRLEQLESGGAAKTASKAAGSKTTSSKSSGSKSTSGKSTASKSSGGKSGGAKGGGTGS
jgi:BMFP domain-containing protein YqiC